MKGKSSIFGWLLFSRHPMAGRFLLPVNPLGARVGLVPVKIIIQNLFQNYRGNDSVTGALGCPGWIESRSLPPRDQSSADAFVLTAWKVLVMMMSGSGLDRPSLMEEVGADLAGCRVRLIGLGEAGSEAPRLDSSPWRLGRLRLAALLPAYPSALVVKWTRRLMFCCFKYDT